MAKKKKISRRSPSYRKDFIEIVGEKMYDSWILMLKQLVPGGRTHRLRVLVAGMLQYTWSCCQQELPGNKVADILEAADEPEPGEKILSVIESLFREAGVRHARTNSRGDGYSIAEETFDEFFRWDFMPWEG